MRSRSHLITMVMAALCLFTAACGSSGSQGSGSGPPAAKTNTSGSQPRTKLRIVQQFGLGFLPVTVLVDQQLLKKYAPEVEVEEINLSSGNSVTEALIAGIGDVGVLGIPPALLAIEKGVDIRIAAATIQADMVLFSSRPGLRSLRDVLPEDKIALPGPASLQAYVLRMAARQTFGDAARFDRQMVTLSHPDALAALNARSEVTLHFSTPPFQQRQAQMPGIHPVLTSREVFGEPVTVNVVVVPSRLATGAPELFRHFITAYREALGLIRENPELAAQILQKTGDKTPLEQLVAVIKSPEIAWSGEITGLGKFAAFMRETGVLQKPMALTDYVWPLATIRN